MLTSTRRTTSPAAAKTTRRLRRLMPTGLAAAAVVAGAVIGTNPASAAAAPAPDRAAIAHPADDSMGSTITAHEGPADAAGVGTAGAQASAAAVSGVRGSDVSGYQGTVDWGRAWANGQRFAYVKATEGTSYTNPSFAQQYNGSYGVGMVRGAYHFALPDRSSGTAQADWFVGHGGGWSADGRTLPPLLDIEYDPYGATCYGLSQASMVSWLHAFANRVHTRTGRYPAIYTTTNWWSTCTGNNAGFGSTSPLFIARYASAAGTLPAGWGYYSFWQYSDSGVLPGDQDVFNGSSTQLHTLAAG